jgi:hypothetical protein
VLCPFLARRRQRRARRREIRAARRTISGRHPVATGALAVIVLLTPVWISLGNALADPGLGTSVAARGAEWFRGHGGSGIVNWAENLWYSHHPPPVGGKPAQSAIPRLDPAAAAPVHAAVAHLPAPRRLTSPAGPELAGEGIWHPAGPLTACPPCTRPGCGQMRSTPAWSSASPGWTPSC